MDTTRVLVLIAALIIFYFLPGMTVTVRSHQLELAIWTLNLLLGWMLVWVVALVWSLTAI